MFKHKQTKITPAVPKDKLGIYIHIPFCRSKCDYCDFYSLPHSEEKMDAYTAALVRHLEEVSPQAAAHVVGTVYIGLHHKGRTGDQRFRFSGTRRQVQEKTTHAALDLVRRALLAG